MCFMTYRTKKCNKKILKKKPIKGGWDIRPYPSDPPPCWDNDPSLAGFFCDGAPNQATVLNQPNKKWKLKIS